MMGAEVGAGTAPLDQLAPDCHVPDRPLATGVVRLVVSTVSPSAPVRIMTPSAVPLFTAKVPEPECVRPHEKAGDDGAPSVLQAKNLGLGAIDDRPDRERRYPGRSCRRPRSR